MASGGFEVHQGCLSKEEAVPRCEPHPLKLKPTGITCCKGNLCNEISSRQLAGRKLLSTNGMLVGCRLHSWSKVNYDD